MCSAEQEDIHYPLATVRESLMFSHRLRYVDRHKRPMPKKIQRETVNRILHLLELDTIANRLVHSLSRGELKRLTIGVELVSNPAVLFLVSILLFEFIYGPASIVKSIVPSINCYCG